MTLSQAISESPIVRSRLESLRSPPHSKGVIPFASYGFDVEKIK